MTSQREICPCNTELTDCLLSIGTAKRHADVYVFCLLKNKDQENIDPMKLEQWSFFVLPTYKIDGYTRSQSSITLNSLSKLVNEIQYSELREEINRAYLEQIKSLSKNTIKP